MVFIKFLKNKDVQPGYLYFYIHFIVEITCFFYLSKIGVHYLVYWFIPLLYDSVAVVPQGIIGYISDKFPKIRIDFIGIILFLISYIIYLFTDFSVFISLFILCVGNACLHVAGAEVTLRTSNGKLSSPAIFVAGGSFGVITGKYLARINVSPYIMFFLILTMIPFAMLADTYDKKEIKYNYVKTSINPLFILFVATFVVIIRGYAGYGIPTSWNKTFFQTFLLFSFMGIGKALGGILSDRFGIRKVGIVSTLLAIPFLAFGDKVMVISLIGVMMFSMTMAITLGAIVSVLKKAPGLAFGFTTIGLFLGTAPIFFIKVQGVLANIIIISVLSIICSIILGYILKGDDSA